MDTIKILLQILTIIILSLLLIVVIQWNIVKDRKINELSVKINRISSFFEEWDNVQYIYQ